MRFPDDIQAALLFDAPITNLEEMVRAFARLEEARTGATFNMPEARPGLFYRLFGSGELMVTFEYVARPPNVELFQPALASPVTGIIGPDIRGALTRCRSHILINVSHGAMGGVLDSPDIAQFLSAIDFNVPGASLPQFVRRLEVCALASRIVGDHVQPQAVHWVQSDQLIPGEKFDAFASAAAPSPLHVHPVLFGSAERNDPKPKVGIRTFGARHFIGGEIVIEPSELPWAANYETALAFIRIATTQNGYIIPDGDTLGPEDRSQSYRCIHRPAGDDGVPLFELRPLLFKEFGFKAEEYVETGRVIDDRSPPLAVMPADDDAKMQLANEWREKRKLAEGLGARFEVRVRDDGSGAPPPAGPRGPGMPSGFAARPVFGRKKA